MSKGSFDDGVVYHAGFPNAAEDHRMGSLSLDKLIVKHRVSTFFWRLDTDIPELLWSAGSVVVVDKSLAPSPGRIVIATSEGDFFLARVDKRGLVLLDGERIGEADVSVWGVVTHVVQEVA